MKVEKADFDIALVRGTPAKLISVYFFDLIAKRERAFAKLK